MRAGTSPDAYVFTEPEYVMFKFISQSSLMVMASFFLLACSSSSDKTIVDRVIGNPDLSTLATAVTAAGLVETLDGPGPFTVFAPVNQAFANLPAGTVEALLENPPALANILTFHVVPGNLLAADVVASGQLTTVQGGRLTIRATDAGVTVNGANILQTDIEASNGVIHLIDAVLLP